MFPEFPGLLIKSRVSMASCSWIVFWLCDCRGFESLKSTRLGVWGEPARYEEFEPWPGTAGGLANLGVPDRRERGAGLISAEGARVLEGEVIRWTGTLAEE